MFKRHLKLELSLRLVVLQCNIQLDPTEQTDGKLACNVWRGVPISDHAVIKFQPALPPLQSGPPQLPKLATEQAADAVWAAEGYLQVLPLLLTLIQQCIFASCPMLLQNAPLCMLQLPRLATEQAADAVWAAEGFLQVLPLLLISACHTAICV